MASFEERTKTGEAAVEAVGPDNLLIRQRKYDPRTASRLADDIAQATPAGLRETIEKLIAQEEALRQEREDIEFILKTGEKAIAKEFPAEKEKKS
jgi:hypothetical protein